MTAELQVNNLVHHVQSVCLTWLHSEWLIDRQIK